MPLVLCLRILLYRTRITPHRLVIVKVRAGVTVGDFLVVKSATEGIFTEHQAVSAEIAARHL